jgi:hypothetical protein
MERDETWLDEGWRELREWILESGFTRYQITKAAGLAKRALQRIDDPEWSPTLRTVSALEDARRQLTARQASVAAIEGAAA